jgi:hypothetical protein
MVDNHSSHPLRKLSILLVPLLVAACGMGQSTVSIPAGTEMVVTLQTPLSTATSTEGQHFAAEVAKPIVVDGKTVVESGATVHGLVSDMKKPGNIGGGAEMTLVFEDIKTTDGENHRLSAEPITLTAKSDAHADVERVAAGTVAGAIVGGIAGGGKGAVVGGLIGAGAGGTWAVATKGDQIVLDVGQQFLVQLTEPTELPAAGAS